MSRSPGYDSFLTASSSGSHFAWSYIPENTVVRPWVLGYKKNVYIEHPWKFLDVDVARQKAPR